MAKTLQELRTQAEQTLMSLEETIQKTQQQLQQLNEEANLCRVLLGTTPVSDSGQPKKSRTNWKEVLSQLPTEFTSHQVIDLTNKKPAQVYTILYQMVEQGRLYRTETGYMQPN